MAMKCEKFIDTDDDWFRSRYILLPAFLAEIKSKTYAGVEDPERDDKRIVNLRDAIVCG